MKRGNWLKSAIVVPALIICFIAASNAGVVTIAGGRTVLSGWTPPSGQAVGHIDINEGALSSSTDQAARILRVSENAADVGDGEFTVEWFIRLDSEAGGGNNDANTTTNSNCYVNCATNGNLIVDGDNFQGSGSGASWIIGYDLGVLYLGVRNAGGDRTQAGTSDNRTAAWRHQAVQFRASDGLIEIFADGSEESEFDGPNGTVAFNSSSTANQDEYLYIGMEKLAAGGYGIDGDVSEFRISNVRRYTGTTYTVPTEPFTSDSNTVVLYHFDENTGTSLNDGSSSNIDGELVGSPTPTWGTADPFGGG